MQSVGSSGNKSCWEESSEIDNLTIEDLLFE